MRIKAELKNPDGIEKIKAHFNLQGMDDVLNYALALAARFVDAEQRGNKIAEVDERKKTYVEIEMKPKA